METTKDRYVKLRWFGLGAISLSVALIIMDSTIVAVAVPAIINDLGLSTTEVQWIQEIYTLVFAALLLVWGRVADRVGRRRILVLGILLFLVSSALCALAPSGMWLIAARAVQGIGGSMILPTTLSLLNANFRGKERTIAFAVWGSTIGGMAAVGPIVGGWLTSSYSWNWAFLINVPLGLIAAGGVLYFVAESRETATGKLDDYLGALLSVVGFGSLAFGLIEGRHYGWWSANADAPFSLFGLSPVPATFVVSILALGGFIALERSRSRAERSVLLDLSLFNISSFSRGNLTALTVSLGEFGLILSLPLWFQNVLGLSALQAGLALVPLAVGSFVASGAISALSKSLPAVRMVQLGVGLEIISVATLALLIRPDSSTWMTSGILFVYGIGVGFATAQLTQVVLADVPVQQSGQAASTQSTARQVGSALGIAILGTALFTTLKNSTESQVSGLVAQFPQLQGAVDSVTHSSGGTISALASNPQTAAIADAARNALTQGVSVAAWIAAGVLLLGLLTSLRLKPAMPHDGQPPATADVEEKKPRHAADAPATGIPSTTVRGNDE
ncbi:MAG: DHA2 family efflux MFS transporter permease subunit [Micrococcaceae bacterium]|nr:DHA2 family efflux MFS transporter permease subunit [Micrococcaceae bacterium]